jgi:syntaxin 1B/2/3
VGGANVVNPEVTDEELEHELSDPQTQIFQQALMSSTRHTQAQSALLEVQSRHNDIVGIERKVTELAQLFNELSIMIEVSDITIDEIQTHAEIAKTTMEQGMEQVTRATKLAREIRKKKWWCLLIVVIIIIVIVVAVTVTQVVNHRNGGSNNSSTSSPTVTPRPTTT